MKNKDIAEEICRKLGGFFKRHNVLVGGSLGLEMTFPKYKQDKDSDIDIFILGERIENWALLHIMTVFDDVILYDRDIDKKPNYKIRKQWRRLTGQFCPENEVETVKIDFIFVDADIDSLVEDTASDLSKFYLRLDYGNYFRQVQHKEFNKAWFRMDAGQCNLLIKQASPEHIKKCTQRCIKHNITLHCK